MSLHRATMPRHHGLKYWVKEYDQERLSLLLEQPEALEAFKNRVDEESAAGHALLAETLKLDKSPGKSAILSVPEKIMTIRSGEDFFREVEHICDKPLHGLYMGWIGEDEIRGYAVDHLKENCSVIWIPALSTAIGSFSYESKTDKHQLTILMTGFTPDNAEEANIQLSYSLECWVDSVRIKQFLRDVYIMHSIAVAMRGGHHSAVRQALKLFQWKDPHEKFSETIQELTKRTTSREVAGKLQDISLPLNREALLAICQALDMSQDDCDQALKCWDKDRFAEWEPSRDYMVVCKAHVAAERPYAEWELDEERSDIESSRTQAHFAMEEISDDDSASPNADDDSYVVDNARLYYLTDCIGGICQWLQDSNHEWKQIVTSAHEFYERLFFDKGNV